MSTMARRRDACDSQMPIFLTTTPCHPDEGITQVSLACPPWFAKTRHPGGMYSDSGVAANTYDRRR